MNKFASGCGTLIGALLLAGCATDSGRVSADAAVTRFHLGTQIARGEIAVEAADSAMTGSLEFAQYAPAIERELTRLGWQVVPGGGRSEQVAVVRVDQGLRERARRSGLSIGIGGGGGSYGRGGGVGVGVGGTIPVGARTNQVVGTELNVRIQRRSDATVAWEGRAMIEARDGTPLASKAGAVDRLATALFRDFPGESGRTIRVR